MDKRINIIGAGVIGISCAYYLHKKGYKNITVYDKHPTPAAECSYQNGSQLSYSSTDVTPSLANIKKAISWLGKEDAPLLIRPTLKTNQFPWLIKYAINALPFLKRKNVDNIIKLALETKALFEEENFDFDFQFKKSGIYHITKSKKEFKRHIKIAKYQKDKYNIEFKTLTKDEFFKINPSVTYDVYGAIEYPGDDIGNTRIFCYELKDRLEKQGVKFKFNSEFDINSRDKDDILIIAAGVESYNICRELGYKIPLYPVKGYSITVNLDGKNCITNSLKDEDTKIVYTRLGDRLRVAGTAEFSGFNYDITEMRIKMLKNETAKLFPHLSEEIENAEEWACLRATTPSARPIIKKLNKNIYLATGNGFLGWTQSLATAKKLANIL